MISYFGSANAWLNAWSIGQAGDTQVDDWASNKL
jgi:hypothetical protein